jgi:hypothetical protein
MLSAHVLIQTEVGKLTHVAQALSDLDGVPVAEDLAVPYDASPGCRRPVWISWAGWWPGHIQVVDGVTRTLTCTCSIGSREIRHRRPTLCLVELRGFEPLTPYMPSMRGAFTPPCGAPRHPTTAQVEGAGRES